MDERRNRVNLACTKCRNRKVRCSGPLEDQNGKCKQCLDKGFESKCTFQRVSSVNLEHYPERSAELQFGSWTPGPSSAIQQASPPVAQPFGYDIGGNQNVGTYGDQLRLQHGRSGGPSSQMPSYSNRAYSTRTHGLTANRASTERPAQSPYPPPHTSGGPTPSYSSFANQTTSSAQTDFNTSDITQYNNMPNQYHPFPTNPNSARQQHSTGENPSTSQTGSGQQSGSQSRSGQRTSQSTPNQNRGRQNSSRGTARR